jgi:hypothetical protein
MCGALGRILRFERVCTNGTRCSSSVGYKESTGLLLSFFILSSSHSPVIEMRLFSALLVLAAAVVGGFATTAATFSTDAAAVAKACNGFALALNANPMVVSVCSFASPLYVSDDECYHCIRMFQPPSMEQLLPCGYWSTTLG